ncbi:hypothetical protein [Serratia sp. M24T3]|nr:hypothetical protein [Serratia sp. M24T3]
MSTVFDSPFKPGVDTIAEGAETFHETHISWNQVKPENINLVEIFPPPTF